MSSAGGATLRLAAEGMHFFLGSVFPTTPNHVGVPGNKRADRLAREAAGRAAILSPIPCTDVFPAIREAIIAIWQERWDARGATSKMGEVARTVSSMGLY